MTSEEAIKFLELDKKSRGKCYISDAIDMAIKALGQEPKIGHWKVVSYVYGDNAYICKCSECKDAVLVYKDADRKWNYCPNCGAKMVEPQKRSE